jgi:hypothetical protein
MRFGKWLVTQTNRPDTVGKLGHWLYNFCDHDKTEASYRELQLHCKQVSHVIEIADIDAALQIANEEYERYVAANEDRRAP